MSVKPLSMLPLPVLYTITYPFYLLLAYVIQYRKKVILKNLTNSFPKKSSKEIGKIKRQFYRHFFDQMIESLRMLSMSDEEGIKRLKFSNPEILDPYYVAGRNIAFVMGHYNNWEFTAAMNAQMKHQYVAIYSPLGNPFANQLIYDARSMHGTKLVSKHDVGSFLRSKHEQPYLLAFLTDQSPKRKSRVHWTNFLNQETTVATGTERYAQILDMVVVFGHLEKVKRGHYKITLEILTDQPKEEPSGRITELHVKALEKQIIEKPQYWLWSHKRWKNKMEKREEKR